MLNACFMEKVDISSAPEPDPWNSLFIKAPIEKYIPTFPILLSRSMSLLCLMLSFPLRPANTIQPCLTLELHLTLIQLYSYSYIAMTLLCLMFSFPHWPANTIQPSFTQELRPTLILRQIPALVFLKINRPGGGGNPVAPVV